MIQFTKASKTNTKLRCALFGPSGSGKTFSALRIATGLADGGKVAVIDTEFGSASKYADRFEFDTVRFDDNATPQQIGEAIKAAEQAGYAVLIIDSMTHAWEELKQQVEKIARARYGGNYWAAWSEGTPMQKEFIRAILSADMHVIATMRVKTHWDVEKDSNGKGKPVRKGLDPEQGKGIEYEFDMLLQLSTDHCASVEKDRTGKYQDKVIDCPDEGFGTELRLWLADGTAKEPQPEATGDDGGETTGENKPAIDRAADDLADEFENASEADQHKQLLNQLDHLILKHGLTGKRRAWQEHFKVREMKELSVENLRKLVDGIREKYEAAGATK